MTIVKQALIGGAIVIVALASNIVMPAEIKTQPTQAQATSDKYDGDCTGNETAGRCADKPFDHSFCQYPDRTTNPVDGCDNSDPCDPAQTKGGSGDCLPVQPTQPEPAKPNTCEGK